VGLALPQRGVATTVKSLVFIISPQSAVVVEAVATALNNTAEKAVLVVAEMLTLLAVLESLVKDFLVAQAIA